MARRTLVRGVLTMAVGCALTVGGLLPLHSAAVAQGVSAAPVAGDEIVVPPGYKPRPREARLHLSEQVGAADAAGAAGVYHTEQDQAGLLWTRYSDGRSFPVTEPETPWTSVRGTATDALAYFRDGEIELRNGPDGTVRRIAVPEGHLYPEIFGSTAVTAEKLESPDGTPAWQVHLLSPAPDGTTRDVLPHGHPEGTSVRGALAGDETGLLMSVKSPDGLRRYAVVSPDTGRVEGVTPPIPEMYEQATISPGYVALYSNDYRNRTVLVASRSDLSAPFTEVNLDTTVQSPAHHIALVGDWIVYRGSLGEVKAAPIAGGTPVSLLEKSTHRISGGPNGTAVVVGGSGVTDWAVRRITGGPDGKPVVTTVKELPGIPGRIQGIALAQGLLSVVDDSADTRAVHEYARTVTADGSLAYGERRRLTGRALTACDDGDLACARYLAVGDGRFARLTDRSDTGLRFTIAGADDHGWSEVDLPPGAVVTDASNDHLIHTVPAAAGTRSVVRTWGKEVSAHTGGAALWGHLLWTAGRDKGTAALTDLSTGRQLGTHHLGSDCVPQELQAAGRWLYWSCGADGPAGVYDRTTRMSKAVPSDEALLGDGYVVTHDKRAGQLVLTEVHSEETVRRIVGELPDTGISQRHVRWSVDRFGGHLAYVDAHEQVHVVAGGVPAQPLSVLDETTSTDVKGDVAWQTRLTRLRLSKPVSGWSMTVRSNATGRTAHISGGDTRGLLEAKWDGRDDSGALMPNGMYTWELTAQAADGVGSAVRRSGVARLTGAAPAEHGTYHAVTPKRIMDTRTGLGVSRAKVGAGRTVTLQVTGKAQVPAAGVTAVVMNVTATTPTATTYITVYPNGTTRTSASNLNVRAGETRPNLVTVPVINGKVSFYNNAGTVNLLADISGYFTSDGTGSTYEPVRPARLMDTRTGLGERKGKIGPGDSAHLQVTGRAGIPARDVEAVVLNVTATGATETTFIKAYEGGELPDTSNLNVRAKQTVPNLVVVPVVAGRVHFYNYTGSVHLIADVAGYYTRAATGSEYKALTPTRFMDTRTGLGGPKAKVGAGKTVTLQVTGRGKVPATGVTAVVMNVTGTSPTASTYVAVYPNGTTRTSASNLNLVAGQTAPNLVVVPVVNGKVSFYNNAGSVHLIADVAGYYTG
ncbi:hypothetical protein [Streptomyces peucetius]|uniref:FlgD Ig-like domain-containing protein n=1 Tax=Streptomyces peucetius TaxID=1950 RepID=A0ABY6IAT0_STRPE|nr:hypothetical protein [Streptomyces peucetius]UYQ63079.1 hypothetical protein OGH68_17355 [Streptomyces peucetius]